MDEKQELLEIYKLHAELADSVSRQRGTTNCFYMLVLSGLLVFLWGAFLFGESQNLGAELFYIGFIGFGGLGVFLTVAWYMTIRSFRQLNSGKFRALQGLEEKLAYRFFKREWELLKEGTERKTYWRLTVVETFVPIIFGGCILVLSGFSVLFSAFLQRENGIPVGQLMIGFGGLGVLLTVVWYIIIRSFRQLNSGKFELLQELEEKLAYTFSKREWELLTERKTYRRLSVVESVVPIIFGISFLGLIGIGIFA